MSDDALTQLLAVQAHFRLPSVGLVEKDIHVLRAIQTLAALDVAPFTLVFGGGTALARAHKLIERMSEDIAMIQSCARSENVPEVVMTIPIGQVGGCGVW